MNRKHWVCESKSVYAKIRGSPFWFISIFKNKFFYYSVTDKASDFKFGKQLGFLRPIIKSYPEEKVGVVLGYENSLKYWGLPSIFQQRLKLATSKLACGWGLPWLIIKYRPEEKGA